MGGMQPPRSSVSRDAELECGRVMLHTYDSLARRSYSVDTPLNTCAATYVHVGNLLPIISALQFA